MSELHNMLTLGRTHVCVRYSSPPTQFTCNVPKLLDVGEQNLTTLIPETMRQPFLVSSPPQSVPISPTKPIPPPASRPRKRDLAAVNQRVVHPPKESCFGYVPVSVFGAYKHMIYIP